MLVLHWVLGSTPTVMGGGCRHSLFIYLVYYLVWFMCTYDVTFLDDIADEIWLTIFTETGSSVFEYYQAMRSIDGDHNIEVLIKAAELKGYSIEYMNNQVYTFLRTISTRHEKNLPSFTNIIGQRGNHAFILRHTTSHFTAILCKGNEIWHLDSKQQPAASKLTNKQAVALLWPLRIRSSRASLFLVSENVSTKVPSLECSETLSIFAESGK